MEIWNFENLGDANVVWLSSEGIGGYQRTSGGIYPHIQFERDLLNISRVRALTSSGSTTNAAHTHAAAMLIP